MIYSESVLGSAAVRQLRERADAAVLTIGKDRFTRGDLASIACFNYQAAAALSAHIATLGVKSTQDLYQRHGPASFAVPRIGAIALAVLGAAFELRKLGTLNEWVGQHSYAPDGSTRALVTFTTIKARDKAAKKREKQEARRRRRPLSTPKSPGETGAIH